MSHPPNFNRLARIYAWMEFLSFGPWLWLTRCTFLERCGRCRHALVLGDGDGRFTARLLRENALVLVDAVDGSAAMLDALLRRAGGNRTRVKTHLADVRTWQGTADYDLIATHFLLDCLTTAEVRTLAEGLRGVVSASTIWIVSEFAVPEGWFGRLVARPVVAGLYFCFGWMTGLAVRTLPEHGRALDGAGFMLVERRTRLGGLLVAECWSIGGTACHAGGQSRHC